MQFGEFHAFMRRYFPIFLLGLIVSMVSVALAVTLWVDGHWRNHPDNPLYTMIASGVLVSVLCFGHFVMIRGFGGAIWAVVAVLVAALLMALSMFGSGMNPVLLAGGLALPMLALLVMNSARHREMRQRLVALRQERRGG